MIDLHTHTTESDGRLTPVELISEGRRVGLEALAITDHDTLDGYDKAAPVAHGIELIRGIELSTSWQSRSVHLLAYFPHGDPGNEFRDWVLTLNHQRRQRNLLLAEKLRTAGFPIDFDELSRGAGPRICRPHFAAAMVEKGYVASRQEAFDRFLGESGSCFVPREEPNFVEAVLKIRLARGVSVLAHPARIVRDPSCLAAHPRLDARRGPTRTGGVSQRSLLGWTDRMGGARTRALADYYGRLGFSRSGQLQRRAGNRNRGQPLCAVCRSRPIALGSLALCTPCRISF